MRRESSMILRAWSLTTALTLLSPALGGLGAEALTWTLTAALVYAVWTWGRQAFDGGAT